MAKTGRRRTIIRRSKSATPSAPRPDETEDRYLKFVRWSEEDTAYVGFCPDLFPWGGVCHGADEEATYHALRELVREEIANLEAGGHELPEVVTRPMGEPARVEGSARATFSPRLRRRG